VGYGVYERKNAGIVRKKKITVERIADIRRGKGGGNRRPVQEGGTKAVMSCTTRLWGRIVIFLEEHGGGGEKTKGERKRS